MSISSINTSVAKKRTELNNQKAQMAQDIDDIKGLFTDVSKSIDATNADFADDGIYNASAGIKGDSSLSLEKISKMSVDEINELLTNATNSDTINSELEKQQAELDKLVKEFEKLEQDLEASEANLGRLLLDLENAIKAENNAKNELTIILGTPSQTRTLDSRSYFFITDSKSLASTTSAAFFLKNAKKLPPL